MPRHERKVPGVFEGEGGKNNSEETSNKKRSLSARPAGTGRNVPRTSVGAAGGPGRGRLRSVDVFSAVVWGIAE